MSVPHNIIYATLAFTYVAALLGVDKSIITLAQATLYALLAWRG